MDSTIEGEMDAPRSPLETILADIVDLAARHKAEGDRLRQLPPALAEAFHQHDVYRLILPRDLGGSNVGPLDYLNLVEKVGRVDGATAWNLAIGAGSGLYVGYLPVERSRLTVADAACCIAGAYAPFGRGEIVEGGYRVSGHWGWASGVAQARWMVFGFRVVGGEGLDEADEKPLEIRQALAPRGECQIFRVSGLCARLPSFSRISALTLENGHRTEWQVAP
jgi:alkylation response protein AidB-like acyl-CoA dehydrogenase